MQHILKITETRSNGLEKEFEITIDSSFIEPKIESALKSKASKVTISGFRPGKAPLSIVRQRYGDEVIEKTLEDILGHVSEEVLQSKKIRPASSPHYHVEVAYESGKHFVYRLHFEMMPSIDLPDVKELKLTQYKVKFDPKDIQTLNNIRAENAFKKEPLPANHKAALGDIATIDFAGSLQGQELPEATAQGYDLELGSQSFIKGFEEGLLDHTVGEEVHLALTFPKDYHSKKLANKLVDFKVTIKELSKRVPGDINEDLAHKFGFKDMAEMEAEHQKIVERSNEKLAKDFMKQQILDALDALYSFDVPPRMAKAEFDGLCHQLTADMSEEERKKHTKNKFEDLKEIYQPLAERRVRLGLVLAELSNKHEIEVSSKELSDAILEEARSYPGQEQKIVEYYRSHPSAVSYLRASILENKAIDFILENAKLTVKEVAKEELHKMESEREKKLSKKK